MLKAETGCRGCLFYLPLSLAHFAAKLMEARASKTGKPAVLTEFAVYNLERNNHFECSKAKMSLALPRVPTRKHCMIWRFGSSRREKSHEESLCYHRRRQRHGACHGEAHL